MKNGYKLLLTASLLATLGDSLFGPFYAVYVEKIGGNILDIGYSMSVFGIATGILMIVIGKLSDKLNKQLIVIFGYLLYAIGTLGYLLITSPSQLFIIQIIFALGTACLSAPWTALYAKFLQKGKEGFEWGLEGGGQHIIFGLAVLLGTIIVNQWGFKFLFLTMFAIQLGAMLIQTQLYFSTKK